MSVAEASHPEIQSSIPTSPIPALARRRWTAAEYHRMGEVGLLGEADRVELIAGDIVEMAPIGPEHAGRVALLIDLLTSHLHQTALVNCQNPICLSERDEPQPDITVLRRRDDYYTTAHPQPADVLLLIEVADTTVQQDRQVKIPRYAYYGIPGVWLLNLPERRLEVYREPQEGQYRQITEHRTGTVSPVNLSMVVIDLAKLFPDS